MINTLLDLLIAIEECGIETLVTDGEDVFGFFKHGTRISHDLHDAMVRFKPELVTRLKKIPSYMREEVKAHLKYKM